MSAFVRGQRVVCVANWRRLIGPLRIAARDFVPPEVGEVYTVSSFSKNWHGRPCVGLLECGGQLYVNGLWWDLAWPQSWFRPVRTVSTHSERKIKEPEGDDLGPYPRSPLIVDKEPAS